MHSRSPAPAAAPAIPALLQGDPLDPVRARQGRRCINAVLICSLLLYVGMAILAFGPNGAGLGPMNRLLGWDAPVLGAVPFLLLFWAPMVALRLLPRRPENSFLCGAQDALDPMRNPNWRRREGSDEALVRWLRRLRRGALMVAATAVLVAGAAYRIASRRPPNAGRPLPLLSVAELGRSGGRMLPAHARVVAALPGYGQAWIHIWSLRRTGYEDVYLPLRAPGQPRDAPVAVVEKATYIAGYETLRGDPPISPFEGELSRVSYPAWMRQRMRASGFTPAPGVVELRRMKLRGREPGNDGVGGLLAIIGGSALVLFCLLVAGSTTYRLRRLVAAEPDGRARAAPHRKRH